MANIHKNWLNFLSQEEIQNIHEASLQVLTDIGDRIEDRALKEKLQDSGCTQKEERILFTAELVDAALEKVPSEVIFGSRNGKQLHVKDGNIFTHTCAPSSLCVRPYHNYNISSSLH